MKLIKYLKTNTLFLRSSVIARVPRHKSAAGQNIRAILAMPAIFLALALPSAKAALLLNDISQITNLSNFANLSGWTFGNTFVVGSRNISVTRLGYFDANTDGLVNSHAVSIWNSAGVIVGTVTVQAGTGSTLQANWRWQTLSSPVILLAGQTYRLGATVTNADYFTYGSAGNVTVPTSLGGLIGGAGVLRSQSSGDGGFSATSNSAPTSSWWATSAANMDFTVVPEPSSFLLNDISQITNLSNFANFNGWTFGNTFVVGGRNLSVTRLGYFDANTDGLVNSHVVSIWNSAGVIVGTVTVQAGTASTLQANWRWQTLSSPVTLLAGQTYRLGATVTNTDYFTYGSAGDVTVPTSLGGLIGGAGVLRSQSSGDGGFSVASNSAPTSSWWATAAANMDFTVVSSTSSEDIQYPPAAFRIQSNVYATKGMVNVKSAPYNAKGDGVTDDTAAIQSAISAISEGIVYLPAGTYLISNTLVWKEPTGYDCPGRSFQGQGVDKTFIKLINNCSGFGNVGSPKPVIETKGQGWDTGNGQSATAFGNSLYSLTVDTGTGNPGAVGIRWLVSNQGTLRSVLIKASDGNGIAGIDYVGESGGLIQDVSITGFNYGIRGANAGYATLTADKLTLSGQKLAAFRPNNDVFVVANLLSTNTVPAVITDGWASRVVLVDSSLTGGAAGSAAIDFNGGTVFIRNVATSGYGKALLNRTTSNSDLATGLIAEWTSSPIQRLFPEYTPAQSLNLTRASVPAEFYTNDFAQWANVEDYYVNSDGTNWSFAFQRAIDSGRQIVYFPPRAAGYSLGQTVIVRGAVRKITGLRSASVTRLSGYTTAAIQFDSPSHTNEVTMERFRGWPGAILINTTNKVILRDMETPTADGYVGNADGVAANVSIDGMTGFVDFTSGSTATIRSLNPEYVSANNASVFNSGATIALLGAKSEGGGTQVYVDGGGRTEALGYYVSPFSTPASTDRALFNLESSLFMVGFQRPNTPNYPTWIEEKKNGTTRTGSQTTFMQFYGGY